MTSASSHLDPFEFLKLSSRLAASGSTEAEFRTAVGRAYYSCFLSARDAVFGPGGRGLTGHVKKRISTKAARRRRQEFGVHAYVREGIAQTTGISSPTSAKVLSDQLGELREMRTAADYELVNDPSGRVGSVFAKYGVQDWHDLANRAAALASHLQPGLKRLPRWK